MSLRRNPPQVESAMAAGAIGNMYRALIDLRKRRLLDYLADNGDPTAKASCDEAIAMAEASMSPNLRCTVLPAYSKVAFLTDLSREDGEPIVGIIRDGAWGMYPDQPGWRERRITTLGGFEFFVSPETVFTYFEVLETPDGE